MIIFQVLILVRSEIWNLEPDILFPLDFQMNFAKFLFSENGNRVRGTRLSNVCPSFTNAPGPRSVGLNQDFGTNNILKLRTPKWTRLTSKKRVNTVLLWYLYGTLLWKLISSELLLYLI